MALINNVRARLVGSSVTPSGDVSEWFGLLMLETAEACGIEVSEARVRIYAHDLADLAPEQVIAAVRQARRGGRGFFPQAAEILRELGPSPEDQALLAWNGLCRAVEQIGAYEPLQIDDWCAAEAVRRTVGSWSAFCALDEGPSKMVTRQQFLASYRQARRERPVGAEPQTLIGICDAPPRVIAVAVWGGRLTERYEVEHVRVSELARQALPAVAEVKRLTDGERDGD